MATRTYIAAQPLRGAKRTRIAPGEPVKGLSAKDAAHLLALGHIVEETPGTQDNLQQLQQLAGDGTGNGDGTGDGDGTDTSSTDTSSADTSSTDAP